MQNVYGFDVECLLLVPTFAREPAAPKLAQRRDASTGASLPGSGDAHEVELGVPQVKRKPHSKRKA